jgi:lysyl-tRNA synthetase, class II
MGTTMNAPISDTASANEVATRRARIQALRDMGIDPYPAAAFKSSMGIREALLSADSFIEEQVSLRFAGRVLGFRRFSAAVFVDLVHDDARLQLYISREHADPQTMRILDFIDLGDFIGVEGTMFVTKRGEKSLRVTTLQILGKSLQPLPVGKRTAAGTIHQALGDQGRLLRERHVALIADRELRQRILGRSKILRAIRHYFESEGFVEVETPILSGSYGGAAATPFVTSSKALGTDFFLRVSPECSLKRALCGGIPKVFEIGKNFRNEGIDHSHSPEFTAIEWYEAFTDYTDQMSRFENLVAGLALELNGSHFVRFRGRTLDFAPPWPRIRVIDAVACALDVPPSQLTDDRVRHEYRRIAPDAEICGWGEMLMALFEKLAEPEIMGPAFVIDHPAEISPLTKRHRLDPRLVERFEPFVAGMEIGNAYSELNDPVEQRQRLEHQDLSREDPYGVDEDFLRAIEHGMPQAGGAGLGIDRIVMILTNAERLSDVLLFPMV